MRLKHFAGLVVGIFFISGAGIAQANLFSNGNFDDLDSGYSGLKFGRELNSLIPGQWDVYQSLPGGWMTGIGPGIEIQYNSVIAADSSRYYVELDSHIGSVTNSSMYQNVYLEQGLQYEVSFMYHARTGNANDNGINGLLDGAMFDSINWVSSDHNTGTRWQQVIWTFSVASSGLHQVGFGAFGTDNSLGGFVDSASLVAAPVPEPATMLLFGTGLVGLAGIRLRSQKKKTIKKNEYSLTE